MERIIKTVTANELVSSVELVKQVFTDSEGSEQGEIVSSLVKEIRSKKYYLPELDLIMVNENEEIL